MFLWFENHSVFTLKPSVVANLNGAAAGKRAAALHSKNKGDGENATGSSSQSVSTANALPSS